MTAGSDNPPPPPVPADPRVLGPPEEPLVKRFLQHSPHAMLLVERDGRIRHANARAEPLLNSPTADLVRLPLGRFLVERDQARLQKRLALALSASDSVEDLDVHLARPEDGLIAMSFIPLAHEPNGLVLVQMRDLTREKAERDRVIEAEAEVFRRQAAENRKMIDLGKVVAGVAHELRTPLTYVANNLLIERRKLEAIRRAEPSLESAMREVMDLNEVAYQGVLRLEHVLQEMRPLTKNKPHRTVRMDLAELVMDALRTFRGAQRGDTRVTLDLQSTHALPIDREDMANVVLNLLNNAAEAMGGSGTVRIETRNESLPPTIRVIDHGPGIAPDVRHRLFEPFYTTKPDGTGLGLFISRRTVEAHGGTLTVEDTPGGGATFVVRLPEQ